MHCWGQMSFRSNSRSTKGQFGEPYPIVFFFFFFFFFNLVCRTPDQSVMLCWGLSSKTMTFKKVINIIIRNSLWVCLFVCLSGLLLGNGKAHRAQTRRVGGAWANLDFLRHCWGQRSCRGHTHIMLDQHEL